jgi:hypothetical protein
MQVLNELKTTIRVVGPTTSPRLVFDTQGLTKEFQNALVAAGKQRLQQEVDKQVQQLGDKLGDKVPTELKDKLQGSGKDIVESLGGLLGGKKTQEEKKQSTRHSTESCRGRPAAAGLDASQIDSAAPPPRTPPPPLSRSQEIFCLDPRPTLCGRAAYRLPPDK